MSIESIRNAFRFTRWAVLTFAVLAVLAMLAYPGGTVRDPDTSHDLFFHNFLSDLGMARSWGGRPNRLGAVLFVSGEVLFAAGLIAFFVALVWLCSSRSGQRRWAQAAAVVGLVTGVGLIVAVLAPADRFLQLHIQSALLAFRGAFASTVLLTILIARHERFSRGAALACLSMTAVLGVYIAVIQWGPSLSSDFGLLVQVAAQKVVGRT